MLEILYQETLCGNRSYNQDALLVKEFYNGDKLLAVADGMGGGVLGGELAQKAMDMLEGLFTAPVKYPSSDLKKAVHLINDTLRDMLLIYDVKTKKETKMQKGGTTLCVVYYNDKKNKITYVNIGDSRVSLCGNRKLKNLSIDQNRYEEAKIEGKTAKKKDKRIVAAILGVSTNREIDEVLENKQWQAVGQKTLVYPKETVILSTDGFHDYANKELFCADFHTNFWGGFARVQQESQDNITIIVAKVRP